MDNQTNASSEAPINQVSEKDKSENMATNTWQRLSPIAILYFGVSFIRALIGQFVYIIPPLVLSYNSIKDYPYIGLPIAIGLVAFFVIGAILSFYFFQYRLHKGSIEIRSGVFSKKHVNLPFERIQNVKIEQPIYYRFAGFACLQLDTAGSAKQEAKVVALKLEFAEQLKREILAMHEDVHEDENIEAGNKVESDVEIPAGETLLNTRSLKDLVIHGVTSNRIWIFLGVLAPLYDEMAEYVGKFLLSIGIDLGATFDTATHSWWELGLYAFSLTMIVMLLLTMFSVFGSIMTFYGYTLTKRADRYIRRSGLFTKHEVTMRLPRLQKIAHKQDWLDLLLKRVNLRYEQTSSSIENMEASSISNKIIVPSVTPAEAKELVADVYPDAQFNDIEYKGISKRYLFKTLGLFFTPVFVALWAITLLGAKYKAALILVPVYLFVCLAVYMRWKRWGYAKDENYIYIRKGMFGYDQFCFPTYKVQQTSFKQSIFMKPKNLCTVKLVLASGAMEVPFISEEEGRKLINDSLFDIESSGKSWM